MSTTRKPLKKPTASDAGRTMSHPKKAAANHGENALMDSRQLRQADRILGRIERRGEALSESAARLLKRVS